MAQSWQGLPVWHCGGKAARDFSSVWYNHELTRCQSVSHESVSSYTRVLQLQQIMGTLRSTTLTR